jgi:hypothetical protein
MIHVWSSDTDVVIRLALARAYNSRVVLRRNGKITIEYHLQSVAQMLLGFVMYNGEGQSLRNDFASQFTLADQVEMGRTLLIVFLLFGKHDSKPKLVQNLESLRTDCLDRWLRKVQVGSKIAFEFIPELQHEWRLKNVRDSIHLDYIRTISRISVQSLRFWTRY